MTIIQDADIEVDIAGQGPTAPIYWRWTEAAGGVGDWQHTGLQAADVPGGWQDDDDVLAAVRAHLDI